MRIVTALVLQKRNKERVNVFLDGEFAFGLNIMDAAQLRKGQQLSDAEIDVLSEKDAVAKAVDIGIRLLSYRPRSRAEIRQHLTRKKIPESVIDSAIERLHTLQYLDDHAFTRFWVENRNAFKPRGERALRYELRQKGVPDSVVTDVLGDLLNEKDAAYAAAKPKVRRMRGVTRADFHKKIASFLQRRGFQYETSRNTIDRLIEEIAETDPDFFLVDEE